MERDFFGILHFESLGIKGLDGRSSIVTDDNKVLWSDPTVLRYGSSEPLHRLKGIDGRVSQVLGVIWQNG